MKNFGSLYSQYYDLLYSDKDYTSEINNRSVVETRIIKGQEILNSWTDEDFINKINNILQEYKILRDCWK